MNFLKKIFPLSFIMAKNTTSFVWGIIINAAIWLIVPLIFDPFLACVYFVIGSLGVLSPLLIYFILPLFPLWAVLFVVLDVIFFIQFVIESYGLAGLVVLIYTKAVKGQSAPDPQINNDL